MRPAQVLKNNGTVLIHRFDNRYEGSHLFNFGSLRPNGNSSGLGAIRFCVRFLASFLCCSYPPRWIKTTLSTSGCRLADPFSGTRFFRYLIILLKYKRNIGITPFDAMILRFAKLGRSSRNNWRDHNKQRYEYKSNPNPFSGQHFGPPPMDYLM